MNFLFRSILETLLLLKPDLVNPVFSRAPHYTILQPHQPISPPMSLDRIDRRILTVLQENNRLTNVELAEQVGLSPPACLKRVRQLRESGVIIGDVSLVNPELSGNKMTMLVSVEMERDRKDIYAQFQNSINRAPEVIECYQTTGSYDFVLIVCVRDIQAYEAFLERVLRADPNIRKFQSSVSIRRIKYSTAIDIPQA